MSTLTGNNKNALWLILAVAVIIGGIVYYQQTTQTASISLTGGKSVGITVRD